PRTDEDLSWLGLIAKAGGDVRHRTNGRIIETPLKPDGAKRRKAMRHAIAEANLVPQATPRFRQGSDCVTYLKRHEHSLERRVLDWHRIVEDDHHAVTGVSFERAVVFDDDFADGRMVVAQQGHHVFRVGPRERKESLNSCRGPPVGTALPIRS